MDISQENKVFNADESLISSNVQFAGMSWLLTSDSIKKSQITILQSIFERLNNRIPSLNLWLFIGNSAWQPTTRIVRYRKLWNMLKARNLEISHSSNFHEQLIENNEKLKFFGATQLSILSVESVVKAISEERCSYLLALPENARIDEVLRKGWVVDNNFDKGLLKFVADQDGLIFKAVGEFDDIESGFVAIGKPDLIKLMG